MNDEQRYIEIEGARVNNLKNVSVKIPQGKLVVIAGVSGSGKSSLAFDTLYAEGQRRYVESLSSYARQFLGRMSKPDCDFIRGLSPAIAIEQKVISRNPRSTVGTTTEIYDYLRMLFARVGRIYSPISGAEVRKHTTEDVVNCMKAFPPKTRFMLLAPLGDAGDRTTRRQLEAKMQQGYSRVYLNNNTENIAGNPVENITDYLEAKTDEELQATADRIYLLIDRMSVDDSTEAVSRLTDSCETAFFEGEGRCMLVFMPDGPQFEFSTRMEADGMTFQEPTDGLFSFTSPLGVCPTCEGYGKTIGTDPDLVIPNKKLSVYDGCVQCWHGEKMSEWNKYFIRHAQEDGFPIFTPYEELSEEHKGWLWHGLPSDKNRDEYEQVSIDAFFRMLQANLYKIQYRVMLAKYRGKAICPDCHGTRLRKEAGYVKIAGKTITDLVQMPVDELATWFEALTLEDHEVKVAERLLVEVKSRLQFLLDVGLGYLTLDRLSNTLSGGESQRINLTKSLGSSLVGAMYILDEPSIGMHSRDTHRLIDVLKKLRDLGNTVIVVEHDEDILRAADWLIDVGPDAGMNGGEIMYEGLPTATEGRGYTIDYLNGKLEIPTPKMRRPFNMKITLRGASMNNLRGVDVDIPLNVMTVVTGVSGSGKSSLIRGTLFPAIKRRLKEPCESPGAFTALEGDVKRIKHIEMVDQNPIGKSTRSNPASYLKAYDAIRALLANQPLAMQMNITPAYFSFNTDGGRCEECKGAGVVTVEMQFMADLNLVCDACHGKRFKHDVLEVRYAGKNVDDILNMTVNEAIAFFSEQMEKEAQELDDIRDLRKRTWHRMNHNALETAVEKLLPLQKVGLGYIKLGQSSATLSGGENQRVKLAYYISQDRLEPTMFIFDEPTTGLHFHDIKLLMEAFDELVKHGHTVVVIEHNMDVIKCADWVVDLGPEGGKEGGNIVCVGTPETIAQCQESYTGRYLAKTLMSAK